MLFTNVRVLANFHGHTSVRYIDNSLLIADNKRNCVNGIMTQLIYCKRLYFVLTEKSMLETVHRIEFPGILLSPCSTTIAVSDEDKLENLNKLL